MSGRPLVLVTGLTFGDYLLWNWSLNSSHDVPALIAGLTFPPLALMLVWMLAVTAARLIARATRRPAARRTAAAARRSTASRAPAPTGRQAPRAGETRTAQPAASAGGAQGARAGAPARKIAA